MLTYLPATQIDNVSTQPFPAIKHSSANILWYGYNCNTTGLGKFMRGVSGNWLPTRALFT
ncbi:hypothetical protein B6N25_00285 [Sphingobacteriales bacterium TSM_CSS]|nr:hypothetical protein B6N25_00285 [Sphingobacteriales bacterium TSM_CSS]